MPQEFNVLCCYSCDTYQVHQVKKSTKWQCKLCSAKQSIKMVFALGSGADCRNYVQKMNLSNGQRKEKVLAIGKEVCVHTALHLPTSSGITDPKVENSESRWTVFLDDSKTNLEDMNTSKEYNYGNMEMSNSNVEPLKKSMKRKPDDNNSNLNISSFKKNKLHASSSREDLIPEGDFIYGKTHSPTSDGEKTPTACKFTTSFAQKSERLHHASNDPHQKIISNSKWCKYVENS